MHSTNKIGANETVNANFDLVRSRLKYIVGRMPLNVLLISLSL
jgi:hypothetical protein